MGGIVRAGIGDVNPLRGAAVVEIEHRGEAEVNAVLKAVSRKNNARRVHNLGASKVGDYLLLGFHAIRAFQRRTMRRGGSLRETDDLRVY